jgi:hypothetical protein
VSTRRCGNRNLKLTNVENSPADGESNREKANIVGDLLPTPNKRKLDQLNYNSDDSAKDGTEGLRPQKQQKQPNSRNGSPMDLPSMGRDTPSSHDRTGHDSGDNKHGNNNGRIINSKGSNDCRRRRLRNNEQLQSTACPALASRQPSSRRHSGEPPHDQAGSGVHDQNLDDPVSDSIKHNHGDGNGNDKGDSKGDFCSTSSDGGEDEDKDTDSDDPGDGKGSNGKHAKRQRQHTSTIRGVSNSKRAAKQRTGRHHHHLHSHSQGSRARNNQVNNIDNEWEVRNIVGERMTESGREYKVVWKDTWVHESGLSHAKGAVKSYRKRVQHDKAGSPQMHTSVEVKGRAIMRKGR